MYAVVELPEEEGVEAIPLRWLTENGKECYWPQFKNIHKTTLSIKAAIAPTKDLKKFPVRVLRKFSKNIFKLVHVTGKS